LIAGILVCLWTCLQGPAAWHSYVK